MRACSAASGARPRERPNQTSTTAIGSTMNCGTMTPRMISFASCDRFSSVSATCTSANFGAPSTLNSRHAYAMRTSVPRTFSKRNFTPLAVGGSSSAGSGRSVSPATNSPRSPSTM